MTTITITPERADIYRALAGDKESTGRTAGEALDAPTSQLSDDESGTLVIVQNHKADRSFYTALSACFARPSRAISCLPQRIPIRLLIEGRVNSGYESPRTGCDLRASCG